MKNTTYIINFVLFIAVVILYVLHFSGNSSNVSVENELVSKPEKVSIDSLELDTLIYEPNLSVASTRALSFPMAYVNIDSIFDKYQLIKDRKKAVVSQRDSRLALLEKNAKDFEDYFTQVQKGIQNGLVSEAQAMQESQRYQEESQKLALEEQAIQKYIYEQEKSLLEDVNKEITNYLKDYQEELKYSYVFGYQYGGQVLFANDSLDITSEVLKGLNSKYKSGKKKK